MRPREDRDRIEAVRQKYYQEIEVRYAQLHAWKRQTWDERSDALKAQCDESLMDRSLAERASAGFLFAVLLGLSAALLVLALALVVNLGGVLVSLFTGVWKFYMLSWCKYAAVTLFVSGFVGFFLIRLYGGWDTRREAILRQSEMDLRDLHDLLDQQEKEKREEIREELRQRGTAEVEAYRAKVAQEAAAYDQEVDRHYQDLCRRGTDLQEIYSFACRQMDGLILDRQQTATDSEPYLICKLTYTVERWRIVYTFRKRTRWDEQEVVYDFNRARFYALDSDQRSDALALAIADALDRHVQGCFPKGEASTETKRTDNTAIVSARIPNRRYRMARKI